MQTLWMLRPRVSTRRIKNKFNLDSLVKGGFRNIHVNIALRRPGPHAAGMMFLCELQVQHSDIWEAEQNSIVVVDGVETTPHDRCITYRNYRGE